MQGEKAVLVTDPVFLPAYLQNAHFTFKARIYVLHASSTMGIASLKCFGVCPFRDRFGDISVCSLFLDVLANWRGERVFNRGAELMRD